MVISKIDHKLSSSKCVNFRQEPISFGFRRGSILKLVTLISMYTFVTNEKHSNRLMFEVMDDKQNLEEQISLYEYGSPN